MSNATSFRPPLLWLVLIAIAMAPASLRADVIELKNGQELEGRIKILATGQYHITVEEGRVLIIEAADVVRHVIREAPMDELGRRLAQIRAEDRDGLVELARWAEDKGLRRSALDVYRRLLAVDPNHVGARNRLGFVCHKNRWVTRKELEGKGLVRFRGHWMTPEEVKRIKQDEAVKEFKGLIEDVHADNTYLRQNARVRILEEKNPHLIPYLRGLTAARNPIERMLAAAVLGNHGFADGAEPIYKALRTERRDEVRTAQVAVLRKFGDARVVEWLARDLPGADATALRGLLELAEKCPHRRTVPVLIELVERPGWGRVADAVLEQALGVSSRSAEAWRDYWRLAESRYPADLGSGWLAAKKRKG